MSDSAANFIMAIALPVGIIALAFALGGFLDPDPSSTHAISAGGIAVYLVSWGLALWALANRH